MTRFARSKGSKASNERLPHDATPWYVMKEQLEISKSEEVQTKTKSAKELLAEKEELYYSTSLGQIKTDWAEFDNAPKIKKSKNDKVEKKSKGKSKKLKISKESVVEENSSNLKIKNKTSLTNSENKPDLKEKKLKRKSNNVSNSSNSNESKQKKQKVKDENILEIKSKNIDSSSKKKTKRSKSIDSKSNESIDSKYETEKENSSNCTSNKIKNNKPNKKFKNSSKNENENFAEYKELSKRQKRNQKKVNNKIEANNNSNNNRNNWSNSEPRDRNFYRFGNNVPRKFQKNTAKIRDDRPHNRRKPDNGYMKITINGMDVEIIKYDGFPIIKKDAERLTDLRKEMILKGIPKNEVDAAMKLERRKCEKALARIRKQVCFHCRKAGHNLSDCPELEKEEIITGICFKCGSTEHTHFECKLHKSDDYKYAKCFICREQGHIAKQCPDNPKGLYPDGGSCKICGDVTHLKKDCPDLVREKEETAITLDTINDGNLESLGNEKRKDNLENKPIKKIVKF